MKLQLSYEVVLGVGQLISLDTCNKDTVPFAHFLSCSHFKSEDAQNKNISQENSSGFVVFSVLETEPRGQGKQTAR